ncbi:hypothetical protein SAMN05444411_11348 [Lutibacter oricola]|uniref:Uncharacterized protein n=1 Tax=Lutibacter oricola TaxID=762486 RepID=A0A1H3G4S8_9FLAO|nr:hypothetical protein [Lutibacter oricola]SDX98313.1 hypothetical protein SAMN05444411_11348 [Lutibacter oricola]
MHKKIESDLKSLAHSILQMKNSDDVVALQKKSLEVFEKLSVLKFVNEHVSSTIEDTVVEEKTISNVEKSSVEEKKEDLVVDEIVEVVEKEEIIVETKQEKPIEVEEEVVDVIPEEKLEEVEEVVEEKLEDVIEEITPEVNPLTKEQINDIFSVEDVLAKDDVNEVPSIQMTLEEELESAISSDVATTMFEKVTKEEPVIEENVEEKIEEKKRSLNDVIYKDNIQVGLNDRIAFVKYLFGGSQGDFNRVLSQLNSFDTEKEAKSFLNKFVKPDYNWDDKEEYEQRLIALIERKFL